MTRPEPARDVEKLSRPGASERSEALLGSIPRDIGAPLSQPSPRKD